MLRSSLHCIKVHDQYTVQFYRRQLRFEAQTRPPPEAEEGDESPVEGSETRGVFLEQEDQLLVLAQPGQRERRVALGVLGQNVGAPSQQQLRDRKEASVGGEVQRRVLLGVPLVRVGAGDVQQSRYGGEVSLHDSAVQRELVDDVSGRPHGAHADPQAALHAPLRPRRRRLLERPVAPLNIKVRLTAVKSAAVCREAAAVCQVAVGS